MELNTLSAGLIVWQITIIIIAILLVIAWTIILVTDKFDSRDRLSWLLGTLFLPILGPMIFLFKYLRIRKSR